MIPREKNYKKVLRTLLGIITVKLFHRLKAMSFGFADDFQPMKAFNPQNITLTSLLLKLYNLH